ncbi:MAG: Sec-independent protein translocase subunit TatA/TatB [Kiritimatiellia bacterium]
MWERGLFSGPHILLLVFLILLLFGAKRIPDLARSLGRSIGEFKKGRAEGEREAREASDKKAADEKAASKQE